jgi:hypothetical protein
VLRGRLGLFYELVGGFATYFSDNPPLVNHVTVLGSHNLAPEETDSLFKVAAASNAAFVEGFAAGENLAQIKRRILTSSLPALSLQLIIPVHPSIRSGAWKCSRRLVPTLP